jgi:TPP-dependent pyruvate/acetoin dehydrogenase alpha subunit
LNHYCPSIDHCGISRCYPRDDPRGDKPMSVFEAPGAVAGLDRDKRLAMYERMLQIGHFEDAAAKTFAAGQVPGFAHLDAGEEAVAVGICAHLTDRDYITSTHRGHGHCIAMGVDIAGWSPS